MKIQNYSCKLMAIAIATLCGVNVAAQTCYPTQMIDNAHGTTINISYDQNSNITSMSMKSKQFEITYNIITEKTTDGYKRTYTAMNLNPMLAAFTMSKSVLTYDNSNRLRFAEGSGDAMSGTEKFVYNVRGQLQRIDQEVKYKDPSGKITLEHGRMEYTYPSETTKNPSEIKKFGMVNNNPEPALIEKTILTYDTQKGVVTDLPFDGSSLRTYAVNNVATADITYVNSNVNVKQTYTYTYNSNGYPISKTYQFSGAPNTDTFTYNCK
ncbi:MAG: hypothetical protein QM734_14545 [Cyclobacteriaceae bacterium]